MTRVALLIGILLLTACTPLRSVTIAEVHRKYVQIRTSCADEYQPYFPLCHHISTGTGETIGTEWMSPEEFTFKYDHDPVFKKSVISYEFQ